MEDLPCDLDLVELGKGEFDLTPRDASRIVPHCTLPFDLPPVLPNLRDELESLLSNPERLPIHSINFDHRLPPRKPDVSSLFFIDVSPLQTTLQVERNSRTGEILGFKEVKIAGAGSNAKNSMSLQRMPGHPSDGIMGSNTNYPFLPGGMDDFSLESLNEIIHEGEIDFENNLLVTPPGFKEGMKFNQPSSGSKQSVSLAEILALEDTIDLTDIAEDPDVEKNVQELPEDVVDTDVAEDVKDALEEVISKEVPVKVLSISKTPALIKQEARSTEWAIVVDITQPVVDFQKQIPNMAHKWGFELDTFQKQAILHLENHDNVFVAAHTSAGKTVVAEYAIALALKHGTKAIYTSPVKALSNQKFRDFKTTFKDIGLLTGDVQVNSEASCLIMTTEILRSMLYNGSDVIRELEWVIFDEVHYINDKERGVVWEEVFIMLPKPVKLVLLSATVSNTVELADWVGRTKKKKIYVISTLKRPVPLEHYLYTGSVGKQQDEKFLVVDSKSKFLDINYQKAVNAKKDKQGKEKQNYGTKTPRQVVTPSQEKNIYRGIIAQLQKEDKLPVVCFTLSRKRCNDNANMMSSLDLTTASEKNSIHRFFIKSIGMLKEVDRNLPQVRNMKKLLERGLGIHHSGILPILKEVVEMLFQEGHIKVLFATETFAMGVNMPARTVVFDSTRKHDGMEFRVLNSSEYIQMAGRAGRRGLDATGTVIILCKTAVPEKSTLYTMMLGKPTELESKFRLTYIMILNLLRAKQLKIEEVMKRSFGEVRSRKANEKWEKTYESLMVQLANITPLSCSMCTDIGQYCSSLKDYIKVKKRFMQSLPSNRNYVKALSAGRVITVRTDYHPNVAGIILTSVKNKMLFVLVLKENCPETPSAASTSDEEIIVEPIQPWTAKLFHPSDTYGHAVLEVGLEDIQAVGSTTLQISPDKIMNNWRQCQEPRFKDNPPGPSTAAAVQELYKITNDQSEGLTTLKFSVNDQHSYYEIEKYEKLFEHFNCITCPSFREHLELTNKNAGIEGKVEETKYWLSDESLQLLPEYNYRISVLMELGYIDEHKIIKMKGRVACQMSNHELLLTEILIRNILTDCSPAESAALVSCLVFQQKTELELESLPVSLQNGICEISRIAEELDSRHKKEKISEEFLSELNFGLTGVVYEWAKGVPFAEIAEMTAVDEGIVVRTIQRLVEVLKDIRNAAHIFGDETLRQKMDDASQAIKRDIVFAASLYIQ